MAMCILLDVDVDTSLKNRLGSIISGEHEFEDMMDEIIQINEKHYNYSSTTLGKVKFKICYGGYSRKTWANFKISIYTNLNYSDYQYKILDLYEQDRAFIAYIKNTLIEYLKDLNETINKVYFPVNENFIFKNDKYYVESSIYNKNHTVEWFQILLGTSEYDFNFYDPVAEDY